MQASRLRVEIIRFSLLIVLTVGLISVAARAFDEDGGSRGALRANPSSSAPGDTSTPGAEPSGSSDGSTTPGDGSSGDGDTGGSSGSGSGGDGSGSGSSGGSGSGGAGSGGSDDGATAAPELPRTGPDTALRLTGVALVLIAGGGLSLAGARRTA